MSARKRERNSTGFSTDDERIEQYCSLVVQDWKKGHEMLDEELVRYIVLRSREVIMAEPMLVPVAAPVRVCGDIHGQIHDLVEIFRTGGAPPASRYLFLGDYVDRGKYGCECISLLLGYKVLFPDKMFLLRGNHESESVCRTYGFFDECKRRFGNIKLFKEMEHDKYVLRNQEIAQNVAEIRDLRPKLAVEKVWKDHAVIAKGLREELDNAKRIKEKDFRNVKAFS